MTEQTLTHRRRSLSELGVMRTMHSGVLACAPDRTAAAVAELPVRSGPPRRRRRRMTV